MTPSPPCDPPRPNSLRVLGPAIPLLALLLCPMVTNAQDWKSDLVDYPAKSDDGAEVGCRLLRPATVEADRRYPLVLFLHGAGERGDDNDAQLKHGVAEFYLRRETNPCFLLAPQCPKEQRWVDVDWDADSGQGTFPDHPSAPMAAAWAAVEKLLAEEPIDPRRIYVTGLSMGGYGTWFAAGHYRDQIAAAVPICGGGDPTWAKRYLELPMWAVHGVADPTVPIKRTREMVDAIRAAGGDLGVTEYPGVGHDSWTPIYADDQLHRWLFDQQRTDESER